jgi:hypothetical protein
MSKNSRTLLPCPCCGSDVLTTAGEYEVCSVCAWEDDPVQSADPDLAGGANQESLNVARAKWQSRKQGYL